jgi:hypothetical protein
MYLICLCHQCQRGNLCRVPAELLHRSMIYIFSIYVLFSVIEGGSWALSPKSKLHTLLKISWISILCFTWTREIVNMVFKIMCFRGFSARASQIRVKWQESKQKHGHVIWVHARGMLWEQETTTPLDQSFQRNGPRGRYCRLLCFFRITALFLWLCCAERWVQNAPSG